MGPGPGQRVPARRRHPARPQGGPAAARGRGRGRGGPGAARGPRPAVRPAAAVPRVQGRRGHLRGPDGRRRPARLPARGRRRAPVRPAAARAGARHHARAAGACSPPRRMTPKVPPTVGLEHLHAPAVSVREQAALVVDRLRRTQVRELPRADRRRRRHVVVVARFLALLELFREGAVAFDQVSAARRADDPLDRRGRRRASRSTDEFDEVRERPRADEVGRARRCDVRTR